MQIVRFKPTLTNVLELKSFVKLNDELFVDPFSNHVNLDEYMDKLISLAEIVVYIDEEGRIQGVACAYMNDFVTYIAHLQMIVVALESQGKGIGKSLCKELLTVAASKGMKKCMLTVDKVNLSAQRMYEAVGYVDSVERHANETKKYMEYHIV